MEEEEELAVAPSDIRVRTTVNSATHPATVPPATALPVTAHHVTATLAMRVGAAFVAIPACHQWTATDSLVVRCSPPRMKMKMRKVPLSQYLIAASCQMAKR